MSYPPKDNDPFRTLLSLAGCFFLFLFGLAVLWIGALFSGVKW